MEYLILLLIGIAAGIAAGLFGIGGGVLIVPALIFIMNFPLIQANGTSLAALLLPVGIFAVLEYKKSGYVNIKTALLIAIGLAIGVIGGANIALVLPPKYLRMAYGFFLLYVSVRFIGLSFLKKIFKNKLKDKIEIQNNPEYSTHSTTEMKTAITAKPIIIILFGVLAGIMSGLFGIGGGLIIVPFLLTAMKYEPKLAIGTSLAALLLPVGLPGVLIYFNSGNLNLIYAAPVALGILLGSIVGAKISIALPTKTVKIIYGYFLIVMAIDFIFF